MSTPPSPANAGWPNAALKSNSHRECALADAASGAAKIAGVYYLLTLLAGEDVAQSPGAAYEAEGLGSEAAPRASTPSLLVGAPFVLSPPSTLWFPCW